VADGSADRSSGTAAGDGSTAREDTATTASGDALALADAVAADSKTVADTEPPAGDAALGSWWKPTADQPIHWHWQLSDDFVYPRDVLPNKTVFDIDGELTSAQTVAQLHALGPDVRVICYFDAGVYEDYRSDAASFPQGIIGKADTGWNGSYWMDIRQLDVLMPLLRNRMVNWCQAKGFDAIEPDETEVWSNDSGFPISKAQNAAFHQALSDMAHSLGLSIGLKGNNTEAVELEPLHDWALTEQCWEYDECSFFHDGFIKADKAVFNVEYNVNPVCTQANAWHMNSSFRDLNLVGPTKSSYLYQPCIPDTQNTW
jgi:hypothetical protein